MKQLIPPNSFRPNHWKSGDGWIWLNAGAIAVAMLMIIALIGLISVRGLAHFWPAQVQEFTYSNARGSASYIGEIIATEQVVRGQLIDLHPNLPADLPFITRHLVKIGGADFFGEDYLWFIQPYMHDQQRPRGLLTIERIEWGDLYGYLVALLEGGQLLELEQAALWPELQMRIERSLQLQARIKQIQKGEISTINYQMEKLRLSERSLALESAEPERYQPIADQRAAYEARFEQLRMQIDALYTELSRDSLRLAIADGRIVDIPLSQVVRAYRVNQMSLWQKMTLYLDKLWEFLSTEPREANTEGGIFPAIFGTVIMVLIMSVLVTPLGVIAAVYLNEYTQQGALVRLVRICVNNLAGVPSIVYGVFGLGFFIYLIGGSIDSAFYEAAKPAPTFGTPGLLWASLTLALLTLPIVIVSTEEGLSRVPKAVREASLALGATRSETLFRVILPMASPAIMTGVILAIARAAGEVAPLMLVGVVKLAPTLPVDGNFPYLHLERKFMHLGFHIFDVGFQSPKIEAARPLVYATAFVLVMVIILLNLAAITIRNRLRERYKMLEH